MNTKNVPISTFDDNNNQCLQSKFNIDKKKKLDLAIIHDNISYFDIIITNFETGITIYKLLEIDCYRHFSKLSNNI